jgi:hypothetical protein
LNQHPGGSLWKVLLRAILGLWLCLTVYMPAAAQAGVEIERDEMVNAFPGSVKFRLKAASVQDFRQVYLRYGTESRTCSPGSMRQSVRIEAGQRINVEWEWEFRRSGTFPPGTRIWWQWEITTEDGETFTTEVQRAEVQDQRHPWNTLEMNGVEVRWYSGPAGFGRQLLEIAASSLRRLELEMGIDPPEKVFITVYPSFEEVKDAIFFTPDWTGGAAFTEHGGVIIGVPENDLVWAAEVIPHELAHLVVGGLVFNCKGVSLPTWLSEGLAVVAEGPLQKTEVEIVMQALEKGSLPRLKTLESGFSAYSEAARLSYGQSSMMVDYLYREYGEEKMSELLKAVQAGSRIDPALVQVYGLDTAGLDAAWRNSLGYETSPGEAQATPRPALTPTRVPTLALFTSAVQLTPTPEPDTPTPTPPAATATPPPTETPADPTEASPTAAPAAPAADPGERASSLLWAVLASGALLASAVFLSVIKFRSTRQ